MKELQPRLDFNRKVILEAISDIPLIEEGDNVGALIQIALENNKIGVKNNDILVIAQKIISKAEGRQVNLTEIESGQQAIEISQKSGRDPRLVQLIINESQFIKWVMPGTPDNPGIIVVKHRLGHMCSGAGIDRTNTGSEDPNVVLLLPEDPDLSAMQIANYFKETYGMQIGVMIIDTLGDHDRIGSIGKAIGVANIPARLTEKNIEDLDGRSNIRSDLAFADSIASTSMLAMGYSNSGSPVILVRGINFPISPEAKIKDIF